MLSDQRRRVLLNVLVGSRAHNLARPDSDYDYRGVFIVPTVDLLALGHNTKHTQWIEGKIDDTSWELGHFLFMATKCNPNILDVFRGIIQVRGTALDPLATTTGELLLRQWPFVLSRRQACDAYIGYANNQLTKMMRQEAVNTAQTWKFATTYLRVLLEGIELQQTGSYSLEVTGSWLHQLQAVREGRCTRGEIIDNAIKLQERLYAAERESVLPDAPDMEAVNHFLLQTRRRFWDWEVPT